MQKHGIMCSADRHEFTSRCMIVQIAQFLLKNVLQALSVFASRVIFHHLHLR
jgi:hypothetical protein